MRGRLLAYSRRDSGARSERRGAPDLSDAADPGAAGAALVVRADPRRRARLSDRAGDAVGRGDGRRAFHHHPRPSWLSGDAGEARRAMARLSAPPSRVCFTYDKGDPPRRIPFMTGWAEAYFRWFDRCLFISNMLTRSLPPKTFFSLSSARISLLFCGFCRLFLRMWSQILDTTWLRGSGSLPVIAA